MYDLLQKTLERVGHGKDSVLITIVNRKGSAPRDTGAMMLVGTEGYICGTIGGGALEGRGIARGAELVQEKKTCREWYSMLGSQPQEMVCGGEVELLFTYIPGYASDWCAAVEELCGRLRTNVPICIVLDTVTGGIRLEQEQPEIPCSGRLVGTEFLLPLPLKQRVIVCGGGHVAQALVGVLTSVDFRVTVLENRPEFADPARFPDAEQVLLVDYEAVERDFKLRDNDFVVIMTHGHSHDYVLQEQLLRRKLAYMGVIGSRKKIASVNARLWAAGISKETTDRVHTPIGLDIGAETPAEIAISIAAECIAVRAEIRKTRVSPEI